MENWIYDFEWLKVRHFIKDTFNHATLPDLDAILFLIGIQEFGQWKQSFTKEEKQDLMHIAVCRLLSYDGFYKFKGRDADGWPHWEMLKPFTRTGVKEQEQLLKEFAIQYFKDWEKEENTDINTISNKN